MNTILDELKSVGINSSDIIEILTERMFPIANVLKGFVIQIETGEYLTNDEDFDLNLSEAKIFESYSIAKKKVDDISDVFMADICLFVEYCGRVDTILVYCSYLN